MKDKALNFILDAKNNDSPRRMIRETMNVSSTGTVGGNYRISPSGGIFASVKSDIQDMHIFARNCTYENNMSNEEIFQINPENI